ncbi:MAG: DUF1330 domain-containing protein [Luminiphilus sp.]|jgi:uncharacterized protein (DUF1330 family)
MAEPTEHQIQTLMSLPAYAPLGVLNLFQFRGTARYAPEDPEFGTLEAEVSGATAFERYGEVAGTFIARCGGRVVFSTAVAQVMIGDEQIEWDIAALMFFPRRADFSNMLADPEFAAVSRHRKAALANHYMLHLAGDPFDLKK